MDNTTVVVDKTLDDDGALSNQCSCLEEQIRNLRNLVKERPKNARALSQLACLLAEQAKLEAKNNESNDNDNGREVDSDFLSESMALAQRATQVAPKKPFGFAALSLVSSDFDERIRNLKRAIELSTHPQHVFARVELLLRLLIEPRTHETKQVEGKIGSASPQHPSKRDLSQEETVLYLKIRETLKEAWEQHETLPPSQIEFLAKNEYRLGTFFRRKHPLKVQQTRSKTHFTKALENMPPSDPKCSIAQFWLATLSNGSESTNIIRRCPEDYVVSLYSTFAARFDNLLLEGLKYVTPTELRRLVDQVKDQQQQDCKKKWAQRAADLGCGTGLSGEAFRDCVGGQLVGVDLSPEMLAKAQLRACYDELVVGDCISILNGQADFDLILACDVFVYIGDLQETFEAAYASLTQGGIFAFSTELLEETKHQASPFILHECARFAHKQSYIESLAKHVGFQVCGNKVCPIRKNEGKDVQGSLVVLIRK